MTTEPNSLTVKNNHLWVVEAVDLRERGKWEPLSDAAFTTRHNARQRSSFLNEDYANSDIPIATRVRKYCVTQVRK